MFSKYASCSSNSNKSCGLGSSGMLRSVGWWLDNDVSEGPIGPTFKG